MTLLANLLLGLIFGCGLILAGMANPEKVLAFLDVAGTWDPSLALVMGGAIAVAAPAFAFGSGRPTSWAGILFPSAAEESVDWRLVCGSAMFGIGWGLSGFCPGPAVVGLGNTYLPAVVFVIAMAYGIEAHEWLAEKLARHAVH